MYIKSFIFISLLFNLSFSQNILPKDILFKAYHRLDNLNHSFKLLVKNNANKKPDKEYHMLIYWPPENEVNRKIYFESINTEHKKPISFWEHRSDNSLLNKKWMSLPITGKVKEVTEKKNSKKEFIFSEIELTKSFIELNSHKFLGNDSIGRFSTFVIESIEKNKKGKIKSSKKFWIDVNHFVIVKIESYTSSGKLYRSIDCENFQFIDQVFFPTLIKVYDFKSKSEFIVKVEDVKLNPKYDVSIFNPKEK